MKAICILTPAADYHEKWLVPQADYRRLLGVSAEFRSWTDPGNLERFDAILPLIAWGYPRDPARWYALLDRLEKGRAKVINPVPVLRWNSDKAYLVELAALGVPTVPTIVSTDLALTDLAEARAQFGIAQLVVKPPISAGADGTFLLDRNDEIPANAAGASMLIQPFLAAVASEGEYSLFYFGGRYSHAISKHPAKDDFRVQEQFGGVERTIDATGEMQQLAQLALVATAQIAACETLAYARVDMLRGADGKLLLIELELIEPSLFLGHAADGGAAFAAAILG